MELVDIVEARVTAPYRLWLQFDDGVTGEVDLSDVVRSGGVFAPLRDPAYFAKVRADRELGTICWPNGADLDPIVLYSKVTGKPIPWAEPEGADGKTAVR